ncbi:hypothetical protein AYI70_g9232 [Smittium culicis]|uniref:Uncharacterized protein n=1 Tax=Smittium culicis TaxID=133412 RepID=A0A1R1XCC9_9FUNG|nr:hypothetical protein AYI70_g9232 [Smittium culicis]
MAYNLLSLNEIGLSSEFKKDHSKLEDIQYRISGITRPIDYFVHNLLQDQSSFNTADSIEFAGLIQILLSDFGSQITQVRMNNVYKASKIPSKAPQILPSSAKTVFEKKEFVEHITASQAISKASKPDFGYQNKQEKSNIISLHNTRSNVKPTATGIMRVFAAALLSSGGGGRSQSRREIESLSQGVGETHKRPLGQVGYTGRVSDPSSDTTTDCCQKRAKVEKTSVKPREPGIYRKRNNGNFGKKGFRRNFESETRIFLSNFYHSQKIGGTTTCAELEVTESITAKYTFQDGELKYGLQANKKKRLDDKHRSIGCIPACSDTKIIQEISKLQLGISKLSILSLTIRVTTEPYDEPRDTQGKGKESEERSRQTNKEEGDKYTQSFLIPRKSSSYDSSSLVLKIDEEKAVRT